MTEKLGEPCPKWADKIIREKTDRIDLLGDMLRMHRCSSDGAMTVGQCIDNKRCGCTCGLVMPREPLGKLLDILEDVR